MDPQIELPTRSRTLIWKQQNLPQLADVGTLSRVSSSAHATLLHQWRVRSREAWDVHGEEELGLTAWNTILTPLETQKAS